jgi:5-methylcytosine-specific restriction endonuclease McrA
MKKKLSEHALTEIRKRYAGGSKMADIARAYGVSGTTVSRVLDPERTAAVRAAGDKCRRDLRRSAGIPTPMQVYRAANLERCKRAWAEWYQANRAYNAKRHADWRRSNPSAVRACLMRRRADGRVTAYDIRCTLQASDGLCAYCLQPVALEVEHVLPISRGGRNDEDNLVAACRTCNARKGSRTPLEHFFGLPKLGTQESLQNK